MLSPSPYMDYSPLIPTYQQPIAMPSSFYERDYERAKREVLHDLFTGSDQKMYVEAWKGVGATALLRELAEEVESKKKYNFDFDTVINVVRPAPFQNRREIQRAVAKQLNLPPSVTDILDAKDKDDDFSGSVEFSSRAMDYSVKEEINRAVRDRIVLLVLCNNIADDNLIDPNELVIYIFGRWIHNSVLWTSGINIGSKAAPASADFNLRIKPRNNAEALDLVYKEAAEIAHYIKESSGGSLETTTVVRCFWYCMLLCKAFKSSKLLDDRPLEAVKYFVCEGILQGDAAWESGRALAPLIGPIIKYQLQYWQETFSAWTPRLVKKEFLLKILFIDSSTQEDWVIPLEEEEEEEPSSEEESYRWISVRSPQNNNPEPWDFFKRYDMSNVSSFFRHFDMSKVSKDMKCLKFDPPEDFFDRFGNIRVLDLLGCIVSPINSSFLRLRNLRMLRLEQCSVVDPSSLSSAQEEKRQQQAIFFDSLWVLNLCNSDADKFLLEGKAFELMPNLLELDLKEETSLLHLVASNEIRELMHKLEVLKLSGNMNTKFLPSLEEVELVDPTAALLPSLKTFHLSDSNLITKLFLKGCRKLENVDLQKLTGLKVLNLSCTAIKVVDITKLPQLKQLFLLGCEQLHRVVCHPDNPKLNVLYLDNYNSSSACDVDHCLDSFQNQNLPDLTKGISDANQRSFQAHVVVRDVRLFRSLHKAFPDLSRSLSHIHVKSSSTTKRGINIGTTTKSNVTITSALCYVDVLNTMTDRYHRHHPSPPTMPLNNHIEVDGGDNSQIVEEEDFRYIMEFANSLFVHDNTCNFTTKGVEFKDLKCLRIERCPYLEFFFHSLDSSDSSDSSDVLSLVKLESIWLSQLPRLETLCKGGRIKTVQLKHIYLEFCARLGYVLTSVSELHNLETINIRYCNDLTAIFKSDKDERGDAPMLLPKLRSIHLQELPKLQHIYKQNIPAPSLEEHIYKQNIRAPSLEELKIRGCFNLRELPLFDRSDPDSMRAVKISCEKDWWDGLESNPHASLFNPIRCPMKARWL